MIVEAAKLQKFKLGTNAFFIGCRWTVVCFMFLDLYGFIKLFIIVVWFHCCFLFVLQFLYPYLAVFPVGAFVFLVSGSPSWGFQSGM